MTSMNQLLIDLIQHRDVANVNRYKTTKQLVGKNIAETRSVSVHTGILVNRHKKKSRDGKKIEALRITPYEHSELYNA